MNNCLMIIKEDIENLKHSMKQICRQKEENINQ